MQLLSPSPRRQKVLGAILRLFTYQSAEDAQAIKKVPKRSICEALKKRALCTIIEEKIKF